MKLAKIDLPTIHLLPGDLHIARKPSLISTILGSCVSICLYAPPWKVGAMCHCLLPSSSGRDRNEPYRYVDQAITHMLEKMRAMNIHQNKIISQIFGGADMLLKVSDISFLSIGRQNTEAARAVLQEFHIPIEKEDVGGNKGRKIFFLSALGQVTVREISSEFITNKEFILWSNGKSR
ncbi:MAG: chemotaxis protein CheD [bacterium]